jgi:hypothetical protein
MALALLAVSLSAGMWVLAAFAAFGLLSLPTTWRVRRAADRVRDEVGSLPADAAMVTPVQARVIYDRARESLKFAPNLPPPAIAGWMRAVHAKTFLDAPRAAATFGLLVLWLAAFVVALAALVRLPRRPHREDPAAIEANANPGSSAQQQTVLAVGTVQLPAAGRWREAGIAPSRADPTASHHWTSSYVRADGGASIVLDLDEYSPARSEEEFRVSLAARYEAAVERANVERATAPRTLAALDELRERADAVVWRETDDRSGRVVVRVVMASADGTVELAYSESSQVDAAVVDAHAREIAAGLRFE